MVPKEITLYAIPFFFILVVWEMYRFRKGERAFPWLEALVSLVMALIYGFLNSRSTPVIAAINQWFYSLRLFEIPVDTIWGIGLLFLAEEFAYYWLHRCAHEVRWFWASHSVHHSPEHLTFSGAYRLGITGPVSGLFVFFVPLFILGFHPMAVAAMFGFNLLYQFWLHTELIPKLGRFEYFFNTPSHHRVHHAIHPEYIDRNYGGVLIIFDRLFGTYVEEKEGIPLQYGLIDKKPSHNPLKLFFQEWVAIAHDVSKAETWRDRFQLAFGRPGWQPESPAQQPIQPDSHEAKIAG